MNQAIRMYEKMPLLQIFQDFLPALVTLHIGHLNWHAINSFAIDYHCASFRGCSVDSVQEYAAVFKDFPSVPITVTLSEGHSNWHGLKGLSTKYLCAKFHDLSGYSAWENGNVWVFQDFPSATVSMTLSGGHSNWCWLKGLPTKYLCAKFHDHSGHSAWENGDVWVFPDFPRAAVSMTLGEGHSKWCSLKGLATMHHCAKFQDCRGHSVWENVYV